MTNEKIPPLRHDCETGLLIGKTNPTLSLLPILNHDFGIVLDSSDDNKKRVFMLLNYGVKIFDIIHNYWESRCVPGRLCLGLVVIFIVSTAMCILNTNNWLPVSIKEFMPTNIFFSIQLVFSAILLIESIELIFALAESVALAVRKQLEIMALILLRDAFKDISLLQDFSNIAADNLLLWQVICLSLAGYFLFIIRLGFLKIEYVQQYADMDKYQGAKKCIALLLLTSFVLIATYYLYSNFILRRHSNFFQNFYVALIFSDILIIITGQYFLRSFHVTFRNSGYAVSTLLMRIALGAPHHIGAGLCVFAGCYILLIAWATRKVIGAKCETFPTYLI